MTTIPKLDYLRALLKPAHFTEKGGQRIWFTGELNDHKRLHVVLDPEKHSVVLKMVSTNPQTPAGQTDLWGATFDGATPCEVVKAAIFSATFNL